MNYKLILQRKYPTADWSMANPQDYDTLVWNETQWPKPSKEWFEQKQAKFIEGENNAAILNRKEAYPQVVDQLDMLWHGMNDDESKRIEPFYSAIKAIKDQFPKR
jgi:hypothetical protein